MGCLRTLTEITGWSAAGEKEKKEIIERIKQGTSAMPVIIQGETE